MAILTYERMDKRTQANNANDHYLFGWWRAYWNALGTHYRRYDDHNQRVSMDKSLKTNNRELDFASETYNRLMGISFKANFVSLVKGFKANVFNMDHNQQTNNLNV